MKEKVSNIAAAVLAGGRNSRMGGLNKAFIHIDGRPIIARTIELLGGIFGEVILVTNSPQEYAPYKKTAVVVSDIIKGAGPLGGIHSALSAAESAAVFFVACDMPFLHNALIKSLIKHFNRFDCDAVVPRMNSLVEPLHAIYKCGLKNRLGVFLGASSDHSIKNFLLGEKVEYFDLEDNSVNRKIFRNLNTPDDLKKTAGAQWK